ncbi:hypothetical protein SAMN05421788_10736 [Filimonas lacunae]|uniref:Circularly permuted type 2 ATP-grasp protein n=1 Tax=Filimonas lacunae TaxID=477680 RepID=A0A173MFX4_9BACT|nr:hypothetical protein [Filimonas lacunae]BAV06379.1 hypothetical protein FLA_2395 [Filimonas lacunae]SIT26709.1 hypothetical protein SAMN05421788_10736 [Filimonas lacunae]
MIKEYRQWFNRNYSESLYQQYLQALDSQYPGAIEFRVAETPVFVGRDFKHKMLDACEAIIDVITQDNFTAITDAAIPAEWNIPGSQPYSHFMVFDFGVCLGADGLPEPQLIEMQGFPSLFGFQSYMAAAAQKVYAIPGTLTTYLNGHTEESYLQLLRNIILGSCQPEEVILLDLFPHRQKTRIDFYCTQHYTGIKPVCLTALYSEGNRLYYTNENGQPVRVKRIYNRLIFDELEQQLPEVKAKGALLHEQLEVEWIPHPDWFYRVSKFTLPYLQHPYIPATSFLSDLLAIPDNLDQYVLKPLFSFSGRGVEIDVTAEMIKRITDRHNWILQRKVEYAPVIETPDGPAKTEIRVFYFWEEGKARPVATHNLARLSKGKMIGVSYNKRETWVGGSLAFFEED